MELPIDDWNEPLNIGFNPERDGVLICDDSVTKIKEFGSIKKWKQYFYTVDFEAMKDSLLPREYIRTAVEEILSEATIESIGERTMDQMKSLILREAALHYGRGIETRVLSLVRNDLEIQGIELKKAA